MLQIAGHVVKWNTRTHYALNLYPVLQTTCEIRGLQVTFTLEGSLNETSTKSTRPRVVWLWLERSFSWLTTSCFSSRFLSQPWFFFPICSYLFTFARIFLHFSNRFSLSSICPFPWSLHLGVFFIFSDFFPHFNFCSGFGCIIHFTMVLLFLQCVFLNTASSFSSAASSLSPGVPQGLKFHRRLLLEGSGGVTGEVRPSSSHGGWSLLKSIHKHKTWKGEEGEGEHPASRLEAWLKKETLHVKAHFFLLPSPQSTLVLLTVCPKLTEKTFFFSVAFKCNKWVEI